MHSLPEGHLGLQKMCTSLMRTIKFELLKLHESRGERLICTRCIAHPDHCPVFFVFICMTHVTSDKTEIFKSPRVYSAALKHHRTILEHDKILIIQHGG